MTVPQGMYGGQNWAIPGWTAPPHERPRRPCRGCGGPLDPVLEDVHPLCDPDGPSWWTAADYAAAMPREVG